MTTITPEAVLAARRWSELGVPRTNEGLRAVQRVVHPDVCKHPQAADAFIAAKNLFHGPDFITRLAMGEFAGNHRINWTFPPENVDLAEYAAKAHSAILNQKTPVEWVPRATLSGNILTTDYGQAGWYFLSEFSSLDERDVGWIIRRLFAIARVANDAGWVHTNIVPETVVVLPSEHGVRLDGWWQAVKVGEPLKTKPDAFTPIRYFSGMGADTSLEVAQIADTMLRYDVSSTLKGLLKTFKYSQPNPNDALNQVDSALFKDFGKPSWHDLPAPSHGEI